MLSIVEINQTILRNQPSKLTEELAREALAAASLASRSRADARVAAACALSGSWPMTVCQEVAEALLTESATH